MEVIFLRKEVERRSSFHSCARFRSGGYSDQEHDTSTVLYKITMRKNECYYIGGAAEACERTHLVYRVMVFFLAVSCAHVMPFIFREPRYSYHTPGSGYFM